MTLKKYKLLIYYYSKWTNNGYNNAGIIKVNENDWLQYSIESFKINNSNELLFSPSFIIINGIIVPNINDNNK